MNCVHDKVYANYSLCSYPPQYPWICKKCGEQGTDRGSLPSGKTYEQLIREKQSRSDV